MGNIVINHNRYYSLSRPFIVLDNIFSSQECDDIIEYVSKNERLQDSSLGVMDNVDHYVRRSQSTFLFPKEENGLIFERIKEVTDHVNNNYFNYDIWGFEKIQYAEYNNRHNHYAWHYDMQTNKEGEGDAVSLTRKLSVSVFLSDEDSYEGGSFELGIMPEGEPEYVIKQTKGSAVFFPSFAMHRVTPVTDGVRRSLVVWMEGPRFK
jgi:PKHD-type hydroxylase